MPKIITGLWRTIPFIKATVISTSQCKISSTLASDKSHAHVLFLCTILVKMHTTKTDIAVDSFGIHSIG